MFSTCPIITGLIASIPIYAATTPEVLDDVGYGLQVVGAMGRNQQVRKLHHLSQ